MTSVIIYSHAVCTVVCCIVRVSSHHYQCGSRGVQQQSVAVITIAYVWLPDVSVGGGNTLLESVHQDRCVQTKNPIRIAPLKSQASPMQSDAKKTSLH